MTITTYSSRSNAARAAKEAATAAGVAAPLSGVHYQIIEPSETPGRFSFLIMDPPAGKPRIADDPGAAFEDQSPPITEDQRQAVEELGEILNAPEVEQLEVAKLPAPPRTKPARKPKAIEAGAQAGEKLQGDRVVKRDQVLAMLARKQGATVAQIMEATGWLPHTTRAFISTVPKKAGLILSKDKVDGALVYRTSPAA